MWSYAMEPPMRATEVPGRSEVQIPVVDLTGLTLHGHGTVAPRLLVGAVQLVERLDWRSFGLGPVIGEIKLLSEF